MKLEKQKKTLDHFTFSNILSKNERNQATFERNFRNRHLPLLYIIYWNESMMATMMTTNETKNCTYILSYNKTFICNDCN